MLYVEEQIICYLLYAEYEYIFQTLKQTPCSYIIYAGIIFRYSCCKHIDEFYPLNDNERCAKPIQMMESK